MNFIPGAVIGNPYLAERKTFERARERVSAQRTGLTTTRPSSTGMKLQRLQSGAVFVFVAGWEVSVGKPAASPPIATEAACR